MLWEGEQLEFRVVSLNVLRKTNFKAPNPLP